MCQRPKDAAPGSDVDAVRPDRMVAQFRPRARTSPMPPRCIGLIAELSPKSRCRAAARHEWRNKGYDTLTKSDAEGSTHHPPSGGGVIEPASSSTQVWHSTLNVHRLLCRRTWTRSQSSVDVRGRRRTCGSASMTSLHRPVLSIDDESAAPGAAPGGSPDCHGQLRWWQDDRPRP